MEIDERALKLLEAVQSALDQIRRDEAQATTDDQLRMEGALSALQSVLADGRAFLVTTTQKGDRFYRRKVHVRSPD